MRLTTRHQARRRVGAAAVLWVALVASLTLGAGSAGMSAASAPASSREAVDPPSPAMAPLPPGRPLPPLPTDALARANWWRNLVGRYPDGAAPVPLTESAAKGLTAQRHIDYLAWLRTRGSEYCGHGTDPSVAGTPDFGLRDHDVLFCDLDLLEAIDGWLLTPLHGASFLDPATAQVGFATGGAGSAAGFVRAPAAPRSGRDETWVYPAPGGVLASLAWWGSERPDPSASCPPLPGNPNGAPIGVFFATESAVHAEVLGWSLTAADGTAVASCLMSGTDLAAIGDRVDLREFVYIFPRAPLSDRVSYRADIEVLPEGPGTEALEVDWSFTARSLVSAD